ncbi:hypothetical protein [Polaromonas sp. YR568]|uniref:hypothetical protein n=1 Tax=Polaromonas sp. YR568 TaxID=1855301 RepID=UPI00313804D2
METPIRIFIAATPSEWLPARVLEFSLQETASVPVELRSIDSFSRTIPMPAALANRPRTPFSFQRFLIPELCGFTGRAIYLDADMLVFRDIAEVWGSDLTACDLQTVQEGKRGRRGQFSVMLLNCETLDWNIERIVADLDAGRLDYAGLMYEMRVAPRIRSDIRAEWNSLEHFEPGQTALLHYTDMSTQPWVFHAHPLGHLWLARLRKAVAAGFIQREDIQKEITQGHVRPSLLVEVDAGPDGITAPSAHQLDRDFVPPYRRLKAITASPWVSRSAALGAAIRGVLRRMGFGR